MTLSAFDSDEQSTSSVMPGLPLTVAPADDPTAWDAFVERHPAATVDHLWGWRQVLAGALAHESRYLTARRGGSIVGVLPLVMVRSRLFGRGVVSMPFLNYGGVLADDAESVVGLVDAARETATEFGASHIELRHRMRTCPDLPCRQHKLTLTRDLPPTSDELWASLDRKVRNQVRKAQKSGLEVLSGGEELLDAFFAVFAENMRDLGTPVYPRAFFAETFRAFPDRARIVVVRLKSKPIAAGITIRFRDTVFNPWASSLREFRPLCPNMLLYWTLHEQAIADGAATFDFGRSSPGGGTHQFKLQWGGVEHRLCWEYVLLTRKSPPDQGPSNPTFDRAIALWKRLPLPVANFVGPIIARHLP